MRPRFFLYYYFSHVLLAYLLQSSMAANKSFKADGRVPTL